MGTRGMRSSRGSAPSLAMDTDIGQMVGRNVAIFLGLGLMAVLAALVAALATWTITDPSFSHATNVPVRNFVGYPGAVVADLAMQLVGLASPVAALPLLVVSWRLVARGSSGLTRRKFLTWGSGVLLASGALAGLPVAQGWPLPTGLGGAFGDILVRLPIFLSGGVELGRLVGLIGFGALAVGLIAMTITARRPIAPDSAPAYFNEADDDDRGGGFMPLAMAHHWVLVARAKLMKLAGRRAATLDARGFGFSAASRRRADDVDDDEDPPFRPVSMRGRIEPAFQDAPTVSRGRVSVGPVHPEVDDEYDASPFEDEGSLELEEMPFEAPPAPVRTASAPAKPAAIVEPAPNQRKIAVDQQPKPIAQVKRPGREVQAAVQGFQFPPVTLLSEPRRLGPATELSEDVLEGNAGTLEGVLDDFGIKGEIIHVRPGPVVTLYELEPAPGVKSSRVIGLADDIARSMSAVSARVAVVPGRNVIGIELPNQRRETVYFRELISSQDFETSKSRLALCLGKTIGGEPVIADLARMPHLLVAGTTGSGKSVAINTMILSLLFRLTPEQCKLIMIDPKMLELSVYDGIPHLLTPVVTDPKKAVVALKWTVREMEDRYRKMSKLAVRNIDGFNARVAEAKSRGEVLTREIQTGFHRQTGEPIYELEELALDPLPYIIVIVDEMADLMMVAGKEIEGAIQRLAQMARAAGIHIVMATQRPSVDVITGTIKANFPTRISFQVTSKIDSRTILGEQGAEQLLGQGDMLYMAGGGRIQRVHGPFVSDNEVEKVVQHLKRQGAPQYLEAITSDDEAEADPDGDAGAMEESTDLYDKAVAVILKDKKASTSYVQRRLQIGYNRAASLIERMEKEGIVGAPNHAGKREILIGSE
jgi:S-DNA-T family DNA segregation ATPase FtsK/SpoIIIE